MPEVTESEYRAKEREKRKYEEDRNACEKEIGSLEEQIAAVEKAIRLMTDVYEDFKGETKSLNNLLTEDREFEGVKHRKYLVWEGSHLAAGAAGCRDNVVNNALDKMEWLLHDLKAKRDEKRGVLGWLKSKIDTVGTWLHTNFFNN